MQNLVHSPSIQGLRPVHAEIALVIESELPVPFRGLSAKNIIPKGESIVNPYVVPLDLDRL